MQPTLCCSIIPTCIYLFEKLILMIVQFVMLVEYQYLAVFCTNPLKDHLFSACNYCKAEIDCTSL